MVYPYPTAHEIEELFEKRGAEETKPQFDDALAPNLVGHVAGYDHDLSGDIKGKDAWIAEAENKISGTLAKDKGITLEIVHVQGGGDSPWAAVELKTSGKTKVGKKWQHEFVYIIKFNSDKKITKIRAYYDSHHVQGAQTDHKAAISNGTLK